MVTFLLATLAVSLLGLITLLMLKRYEMRTGRRLMGAVRPVLDSTVGKTYNAVERRLPHALRHGSRHGLWAAAGLLRVLWLRAMHFVAGLLETLLSRIQKKTGVRPGNREASSFLREVAEHKRKLGESDDRAIFEE